MKVLAVVGSAPCMKDDLRKLLMLCHNECDYMAVGIDVAGYPMHWKYGATYHKEDLEHMFVWCNEVIHHEHVAGVSIVIPLEEEYKTKPSGSSALLGVFGAIKLGYDRIVLCGCPMEGKNPGHPGADYNMFQQTWFDKYHLIKPFTRSMSGFTRDLLGKPTREFLQND